MSGPLYHRYLSDFVLLPEEGPSLGRNVVVNKLCFSYTVAFNHQAGYTLLCTVVLLLSRHMQIHRSDDGFVSDTGGTSDTGGIYGISDTGGGSEDIKNEEEEITVKEEPIGFDIETAEGKITIKEEPFDVA